MVEETAPEYYFPDIIKDVITRVSQFFENRDTDQFSLAFNKGLYEQVGKDRSKSATFLEAWLVMPFTEVSAKDDSYCSDVTARIIIATDTKAGYSMDEREQVNIFPRLIPVKNKIIEELKKETRLRNPLNIDKSERILPYWGGGDVNGPGQNNLWKTNADCLDLFDIKLKKEHYNDGLPFTNIQ